MFITPTFTCTEQIRLIDLSLPSSRLDRVDVQNNYDVVRWSGTRYSRSVH